VKHMCHFDNVQCEYGHDIPPTHGLRVPLTLAPPLLHQVNTHSRTPHGFALAPGMWATGYHEDADRRSTLSMLRLFAEVWPDFPQHPVTVNACGTVLRQAAVAPMAGQAQSAKL
jgi:hypothetical protein